MSPGVQKLLSRAIWNGDCLEWQGYRDELGYGRIRYRTKHYPAHRLMWIETHQADPIAYDVCHTCDNRACINPEHLWLGTHQDNMDDKKAKGRAFRLQGISHHAAKLTEKQVRAVFADPRRYIDIATDYRISIPTVGNIKTRKIWRHLEVSP